MGVARGAGASDGGVTQPGYEIKIDEEVQRVQKQARRRRHSRGKEVAGDGALSEIFHAQEVIGTYAAKGICCAFTSASAGILRAALYVIAGAHSAEHE